MVAVHQPVSRDLGPERLPAGLSAVRRAACCGRSARASASRSVSKRSVRSVGRRRCMTRARSRCGAALSLALVGRAGRSVVFGQAARSPVTPVVVVETARGTFAFETVLRAMRRCRSRTSWRSSTQGFYDGAARAPRAPGLRRAVRRSADARRLRKRALWGKGAAAAAATPIGVAEISAKRTAPDRARSAWRTWAIPPRPTASCTSRSRHAAISTATTRSSARSSRVLTSWPDSQVEDEITRAYRAAPDTGGAADAQTPAPARDTARRTPAGTRPSIGSPELLLDHRGVGDRLRREVVVRVEIHLLDELARGAGRLGELAAAPRPSRGSCSGPRPSRASTTARRSGRAAACSRSPGRSAGSSAGSSSRNFGSSICTHAAPKPFSSASVSPNASLQLRCRSSTATG